MLPLYMVIYYIHCLYYHVILPLREYLRVFIIISKDVTLMRLNKGTRDSKHVQPRNLRNGSRDK